MSWRSKASRWLRGQVPNARNYTILRLEAISALQRVRNALTPEHRARLARLADQRGLAINLGSGGRGLPGWVNVDAVAGARDDALPLDLRHGLPFADGSVRRAFAEHVIEHLHFRDEAPVVLGEILRVLEPGGVARIIVPDVERYVRAYASGDRAQWRELGWDPANLPHDIVTPMHVLNHVFQQDGEHLFGYDFETLSLLLRQAGFVQITKQRYGESLDPELAIDREEHAQYSLYVDARKPHT